MRSRGGRRVVTKHDEKVEVAAGDGIAAGKGAKQVDGGDVGIRPVALFDQLLERPTNPWSVQREDFHSTE